MIDAFLRDLQRPEYLHVLLNPLPVYGLAVALLGLVLALCMKAQNGRTVALSLICFCAASAWPVMHYGEAAEDSVVAISDQDGEAWLKAHARRADQLIYFFDALVVCSVAAIFAPMKWPKTGVPLMVVTLLLAVASLVAGSYIAQAGGKIRHKEFRNVPPPVIEGGESR